MKKMILWILLPLLLSACSFVIDPTKPPYVPTAPSPSVSVLPEDVCLDIKGNINDQDEHIYHMEGQANYNNVKIDKDGEAFFCSEEEAQEAGFRKALR